MRHRRPAFTLLEMMVAMGIILILLAILFGVVKTVSTASRKTATLQTLAMLETMQNEYEISSNAVPLTNSMTVSAPQGSMTKLIAQGGSRDDPSAVLTTATIIQNYLLAMSTNLAAFNRIPAEQIYMTGMNTNPVFLDGWGNPIIFVPVGGLTGVYINYSTSNPIVYCVTSVGNLSTPPPVYASGSTGPYCLDRVNTTSIWRLYRYVGSVTGSGSTLTPATGNPDWVAVPTRGFWASAGPDGFFTTNQSTGAGGGDDNVYSFQRG